MTGDKRRVKVSLIIPVYNTAAYLRDCLGSVMGQTFQDWEAIVVDDGSTDGSGEICRELSQQDPRIRLIFQENRGVSAARNRGLEVAVRGGGQYLLFLDSDDAIHPRLLEELVREAEVTGADLTFTDLLRVDDVKMEDVLVKPDLMEPLSWKVREGEAARRWFHEIGSLGMLMRQQINGRIMRREFVGKLRFRENLRYGEDTFFLYQLNHNLSRLAYLDRAWLYYRVREGSLTHSFGLPSLQASREVFHMIREEELRAGEEQNAIV